MPMTCARCGAQNPDGNIYCQACGTPLTAAPVAVASTLAPPGPPPPPPPGIGPPVFSPTGYQSPYYAPTGAAIPVHRTPWMMIIAGVVALVVLMAGCGTALAVLGNRASNTSGAGIGDVSSPTPGVTPSPIASPTTNPRDTVASNDGLTTPLPPGWSVASKDAESIILTDPNGDGSV